MGQGEVLVMSPQAAVKNQKPPQLQTTSASEMAYHLAHRMLTTMMGSYRTTQWL